MSLLGTSRRRSSTCARWSRESPSLLAAHRTAAIISVLDGVRVAVKLHRSCLRDRGGGRRPVDGVPMLKQRRRVGSELPEQCWSHAGEVPECKRQIWSGETEQRRQWSSDLSCMDLLLEVEGGRKRRGRRQWRRPGLGEVCGGGGWVGGDRSREGEEVGWRGSI